MWVDLILFVTLLIASVTDLKSRKVSNMLVLTAFVFVILILISEHKFPEAVFKALPAIFLVMFFYITNIGGGDSKLLILLSLTVPSIKFLIIILVMFFIGTIIRLFKKIETVPLVPGMLMGFLFIQILK